MIDAAHRPALLAALEVPAQSGGATGEDGAPRLRLAEAQRVRGEIGRTEGAQDLGQAPRGGNPSLSAARDRAVPGARWSRSGGFVPDAGRSYVQLHIRSIMDSKLLCAVALARR